MVRHIFITDPFADLKPDHDTSLALMRAGLECGDRVWQAELSGLYFKEKLLQIEAREIQLSSEGHLSRHTTFSLRPDQEKYLIWMRKDPPVDQAFIRACQLLRLVSLSKVINRPDSLLFCDEKLFALEFLDLVPDTYVLSSVTKALAIVHDSQKTWIAKPIGGKAGEGILGLRADDRNLGSLLDMLTHQGCFPFILQEFLPQISEGDKRIFLWAGEPIGAVTRLAKNNDYRANMAAGGTVAKAGITSSDRQICERLKPRLLELGLYLVGIDVIGDRLTEINITSPTMLEEINALNQTNLGHKIIQSSHTLL